MGEVPYFFLEIGIIFVYDLFSFAGTYVSSCCYIYPSCYKLQSLPALDKSRATDYNNSRKLSQILIFEDLNRNCKFVILITLFLLLLFS